MRVVQDDLIADYLEKKLNVKFSKPYHAIGFLTDDGRLLSAFLFNDFNGSNIEMTIAAEKGGVTRAVLREVSNYVFNQLGCKRLSAKIKRSNKRALKAAYRFGFKYEGISKHYFPDADGVRFFMLAQDCKWIAHAHSIAS